MIKNLFDDILNNKEFYFSANDGDSFESKIKNQLKRYGFDPILHVPREEKIFEEISKYENINKSDAKKIMKSIKTRILEKNTTNVFKNPFDIIKNAFIYQPNGPQNFPDFLIITNNWLIPIEVKYSKKPAKQKKKDSVYPMWNSNLPKHNAIYIFGIASTAVTFFMGSDILNIDTRQALLDFFRNIDQKKEDLDEKLKHLENNFGLYPYVRKAYEHKASKSTKINTMKNGALEVESYFSDKMVSREANVMLFLKDLEK